MKNIETIKVFVLTCWRVNAYVELVLIT